ncbi:MAG: acyl-CoA dehydrogenase family protein [Rhodospirillales bacterium]|nr:acyl-CoA dehydrogenase family protein [Rhodospirillales bacterium]
MAPDGSLHEALTETAAAMVPVLLERQKEADTLRRIPDSTHRDFLDAGLYRIYQPRRYGGLECENRALIDIAGELGRGCGSSAWIFTNLVAQSLVLSMNCVEAQDDVWGENPEALIASGLSVTGAKTEPVEDGILLDGLWSFSSGVDFADWLHLQVFVPREEGPPEPRFALIPRGSFEIVDDWNATGLLATGSKSVRLNDVFVPDYRTVAAGVLSGGKGLARDLNSAPLYQISIWSAGTQIFSAPAVGIARGALDYVEDEFRDRVGVVGVKLSELPTAQARVAEANAEIDAAKALLLQVSVEATDFAERDVHPELEQRARWRLNNAYATQLSIRAVERLYPLLGARGLDAANPFMRAWRDVHAVGQQITQAWDMQATNAGRIRFGLPSVDPRL